MDTYERRLILVCGAGGLLATIDYILIAAAPLPLRAATLMFFAFGPLVIMGIIGLAAYLNRDGPRVSVELGKVFGIAAGVLVNLMAVVQILRASIFAATSSRPPTPPPKPTCSSSSKAYSPCNSGSTSPGTSSCAWRRSSSATP